MIFLMIVSAIAAAAADVYGWVGVPAWLKFTHVVIDVVSAG